MRYCYLNVVWKKNMLKVGWRAITLICTGYIKLKFHIPFWISILGDKEVELVQQKPPDDLRWVGVPHHFKNKWFPFKASTNYAHQPIKRNKKRGVNTVQYSSYRYYILLVLYHYKVLLTSHDWQICQSCDVISQKVSKAINPYS